MFGRSVPSWNHEKLLGDMSYLAQTGHVIAASVRDNLFADDSIDDLTLDAALRDAGMTGQPDDRRPLLDQPARELSEGRSNA